MKRFTPKIQLDAPKLLFPTEFFDLYDEFRRKLVTASTIIQF